MRYNTDRPLDADFGDGGIVASSPLAAPRNRPCASIEIWLEQAAERLGDNIMQSAFVLVAAALLPQIAAATQFRLERALSRLGHRSVVAPQRASFCGTGGGDAVLAAASRDRPRSSTRAAAEE